MTALADLLDKPDELLELDPEDLAVPLLRHIEETWRSGDRGPPHRGNFMNSLNIRLHGDDVPPDTADEILKALTETWMWLEHERLLAPLPAQDAQYITKRGKQFLEHADPISFKALGLGNKSADAA